MEALDYEVEQAAENELFKTEGGGGSSVDEGSAADAGSYDEGSQEEY